ncbi:Rv3654c family TadE-like protein [Streptomyces sp. NPDC058195]|uniref:Rv3654c family TadE-like protein n=1 Tax=Streptomyces sp. NPDC058195 TaxID=3346375 RepID=UPI0036E2D473
MTLMGERVRAAVCERSRAVGPARLRGVLVRLGAVALVRGGGDGSGGGDRGLATVWVAMTTATLCAVFAVVLALGQVVVVRHRAGGAADLAALAAADRALRGPEEACAAAGKVAAAQGAAVVRCVVSGELADVTARVAFGPYTPEVRSRAGPPAAAPGAPGPVSSGPVSSGPAFPGPAFPGSVSSGPVPPVRPSPVRSPPVRPFPVWSAPALRGSQGRTAAAR